VRLLDVPRDGERRAGIVQRRRRTRSSTSLMKRRVLRPKSRLGLPDGAGRDDGHRGGDSGVEQELREGTGRALREQWTDSRRSDNRNQDSKLAEIIGPTFWGRAALGGNRKCRGRLIGIMWKEHCDWSNGQVSRPRPLPRFALKPICNKMDYGA